MTTNDVIFEGYIGKDQSTAQLGGKVWQNHHGAGQQAEQQAGVPHTGVGRAHDDRLVKRLGAGQARGSAVPSGGRKGRYRWCIRTSTQFDDMGNTYKVVGDDDIARGEAGGPGAD